MTNRDTQDILMGKLLDMEEISSENHQTITKSLETIAEVLTLLNERVTKLEEEANG